MSTLPLLSGEGGSWNHMSRSPGTEKCSTDLSPTSQMCYSNMTKRPLSAHIVAASAGESGKWIIHLQEAMGAFVLIAWVLKITPSSRRCTIFAVVSLEHGSCMLGKYSTDWTVPPVPGRETSGVHPFDDQWAAFEHMVSIYDNPQ